MPRDEFVRVMASAGLMAPDVEGGPDGSGGDREAPLIALDSGPADGDQAAPPERASARPAPPAIIAPAEPDAPVPRPGDAPGETSAWRGRSAVASPATAPGGTSSGGEAQMPAQGGAAGAGGTAGAHGQPAPRVPFIPPPPPPPYGPVAPHSHPPPLGDPPPRAKASGVPSALGKAPGAAMGEVEGPEAAARGRVASSMGTSVRPPSLAELEVGATHWAASGVLHVTIPLTLGFGNWRGWGKSPGCGEGCVGSNPMNTLVSLLAGGGRWLGSGRGAGGGASGAPFFVHGGR